MEYLGQVAVVYPAVRPQPTEDGVVLRLARHMPE
jgi:hypothetical protein